MATKKKAVKQGNTQSNIVPAEKPQLASVEALEAASISLWESFASSISNLTPDQYAPAIQFIRTTEKLAEDAGKVLKPLIVGTVKARGKRETDAGTMRLTLGDYKLEIQPMSTALDEKKVEALLRAKGMNPNTHMDTVIKYKVNQGKLDTLVSEGKLSKDELEGCKPAENWKVMTPKKED